MSEPQPIYRIDAFTDRVFGALVIAATLAVAGPAPGAALGAELMVEVVGLRSDDGNVHFALYDNPATFPDDEGRLRGTNVPIAGRRAVAVFKDLTPGSYAVAVFHDENANGSFDQGFLGSLAPEVQLDAGESRPQIVPHIFRDGVWLGYLRG